MKIFVKGMGEVTLDTRKDFVNNGGEGSIYTQGNTAFKIYADPDKMIPVAKMQELSVLDIPSIIRPDKLILNGRKQIVGHTMRFVRNTVALHQLFSRAFKLRNHIDNKIIIELVKKFREMIAYIHSKNILVVDLNELNFLVEDKFKEIYAIDVNSYQTPNFPATAIMEHIRDRHCKTSSNGMYIFTPGSDWFSWAVLVCELFVGLHPYRGGHPKFEQLALDERMNARMMKNVSIFNKDATVPAACQSFDNIPPILKQWFIAVFENGLREAPPQDFFAAVAQIAAKVKEITGSNMFDIKEMGEYDNEIIDVYFSEDTRIVVTTNNAYWNNREIYVPVGAKIGFSSKLNKPVATYIENGKVKLYDIQRNKNIDVICDGESIICSGNTTFVQTATSILQINLTDAGENILASLKKVGSIFDVAAKPHVHYGVVIQNVLGTWYASLLAGNSKCYQIPLPELKTYEVVEAKFENKVLVVVAINRRTGKYDRFILRFDDDFATFDTRKTENINYTGINMTVGDQGICLLMNELDNLEMFKNAPNSSIQVVDDPSIEGDMRLFHEGTRMMLIKGNKIYSIKRKMP